MTRLVKRFQMTEGSTTGGYYQIRVFRNNMMVESIEEKTMDQAYTKLHRLGYELERKAEQQNLKLRRFMRGVI